MQSNVISKVRCVCKFERNGVLKANVKVGRDPSFSSACDKALDKETEESYSCLQRASVIVSEAVMATPAICSG